MKSINLKLGIVSLGLLLNASCKKEQNLTLVTVSKETIASAKVENYSKKIFGESNPFFDNVKKKESDYSNYNVYSLKKENNYFVFTDYKDFFKALETINTLTESKYAEFAIKYEFKCRKESYNSFLLNKLAYPKSSISFQGYFRLLNKDGVVKIGNELHLYKNKSLVIIKNGDTELIKDGIALSDDLINNKQFSVSQITTYGIDYTNNLSLGVVDGNHISSLSANGDAVLVTSPLPGLADAYNYSFYIRAVSMAPVNQANFGCDVAFSYFRCILKYNNYLGNQISQNSNPFTQGGIYNTLSTVPTMWTIIGNTGQALIPAGTTFTGSYCSQVGYWEKYSKPGYIGTGGAYQMKALFNSCKPF